LVLIKPSYLRAIPLKSNLFKIYKGNVKISGNKRLASINTPAVMVSHTNARTGAEDKKPFNGILLLDDFI
jgi:hypothetical protein